jgi:hypothetical protein
MGWLTPISTVTPRSSLAFTSRRPLTQLKRGAPHSCEIYLLAAPGAISAAIILAAKAQGEIAGMAAVLGALLVVMGVAALFMLMAQEIHRAIGVTAQNVVPRLSGILLAAAPMQFVFDGLAASGLLAAGK